MIAVEPFILWFLSACALPPALDALGRFARLATDFGSVPGEPGKLRRILILIPSRAEGDRFLGLTEDFKREALSAPDVALELIVVLDGGDAGVEASLAAGKIEIIVKEPAGPSKGEALAFATRHLDELFPGRIDGVDFVMVFDADMRLPPGWLLELSGEIVRGTEAFQLPVRPAGDPVPGAARVEAFSLAVATRVEDRIRDARGLPVRLRGKAMGFSPKAWRVGPACATKTLAEDSEATLALLARGIRIRAFPGPVAFDEPSGGTIALSAPRARWLAGHWKLAFVGFRDFLRLALRRPVSAAILASDLFLRPRLLVLFSALVTALVATLLLGAGRESPLLLGLFALSWGTLVVECAYYQAARRLLGFSSEIPPVRPNDLVGAAAVWLRAIGMAVTSPGRWHRAREERTGPP